jgi:hypothetical protein
LSDLHPYEHLLLANLPAPAALDVRPEDLAADEEETVKQLSEVGTLVEHENNWLGIERVGCEIELKREDERKNQYGKLDRWNVCRLKETIRTRVSTWSRTSTPSAVGTPMRSVGEPGTLTESRRAPVQATLDPGDEMQNGWETRAAALWCSGTGKRASRKADPPGAGATGTAGLAAEMKDSLGGVESGVRGGTAPRREGGEGRSKGRDVADEGGERRGVKEGRMGSWADPVTIHSDESFDSHLRLPPSNPALDEGKKRTEGGRISERASWYGSERGAKGDRDGAGSYLGRTALVSERSSSDDGNSGGRRKVPVARIEAVRSDAKERRKRTFYDV